MASTNRKGVFQLTKYVVKRILLAIVTILIVCGITFFAMNAIPGGPFDGEKAVSPEVKAALEKRYNLDKPIPEQFVIYMNNLLHGDFGISTKTGRDIKTLIFESFRVSAKLGGMAILVALALGLVFGSLAALTRNKLPDRLIIFFSTLFTSLPSFRVCHAAVAGVLCPAEVDTGMGCQSSELYPSGHCAGSISNGLYYASYQDQHA